MVLFPLLGCSEAIICRKKEAFEEPESTPMNFLFGFQIPMTTFRLMRRTGRLVRQRSAGSGPCHSWPMCQGNAKCVFVRGWTPLKLKDKLVPHQSLHRDRYCSCTYAVIFPLNRIWAKLIGHTVRWLVKCYEMCHVWEPNEFPSIINSWHSIHSSFCGLSWNAPKQSLRAP